MSTIVAVASTWPSNTFTQSHHLQMVLEIRKTWYDGHNFLALSNDEASETRIDSTLSVRDPGAAV